MSDVMQNWTTYSVDKVIQNGVEYSLWISQSQYDAVVQQLSEAQMREVPEFIATDTLRNTNESPSINSQMWDVFKPDMSKYYCFFWLHDSDTTAYSKLRLCAFTKAPLANAGYVRTSLIASDRFHFSPAAWRMKTSWNNVLFSALRYEYTSSSSSTSSKYYCCNYDSSSGFSTVTDCWIVEVVWLNTVYQNRENSCWITAAESLPALNKITLSVGQAWWASNYYKIVWTLNNN